MERYLRSLLFRKGAWSYTKTKKIVEDYEKLAFRNGTSVIGYLLIAMVASNVLDLTQFWTLVVYVILFLQMIIRAIYFALITGAAKRLLDEYRRGR